jgi:hypothetical protein
MSKEVEDLYLAFKAKKEAELGTKLNHNQVIRMLLTKEGK